MQARNICSNRFIITSSRSFIACRILFAVLTRSIPLKGSNQTTVVVYPQLLANASEPNRRHKCRYSLRTHLQTLNKVVWRYRTIFASVFRITKQKTSTDINLHSYILPSWNGWNPIVADRQRATGKILKLYGITFCCVFSLQTSTSCCYLWLW